MRGPADRRRVDHHGANPSAGGTAQTLPAPIRPLATECRREAAKGQGALPTPRGATEPQQLAEAHLEVDAPQVVQLGAAKAQSARRSEPVRLVRHLVGGPRQVQLPTELQRRS